MFAAPAVGRPPIRLGANTFTGATVDPTRREPIKPSAIDVCLADPVFGRIHSEAHFCVWTDSHP